MSIVLFGVGRVRGRLFNCRSNDQVVGGIPVSVRYERRGAALARECGPRDDSSDREVDVVNSSRRFFAFRRWSRALRPYVCRYLVEPIRDVSSEGFLRGVV